jgi:hypothetical protein
MNRVTPHDRTRGITWRQFCVQAARLPGVEQGICYGTPALYVRKRFLARLKEDGETVAIKVDFADRDVLLEADSRAFYLTDHYRPYPAVLMRLDQVRRGVAMELLERAWRRAAPKRLVLVHASSRGVEPAQMSAAANRRDLGVGRRRRTRG